MASQISERSLPQWVVALVDGDAAVRRDRQLMLRGENFDVRSYGSSAALVADPNARAAACIVVDVASPEVGGAALIRKMRDNGWQGRAIHLREPVASDDQASSTDATGDAVLSRSVADRPLLEAIRTALEPVEETLTR